MKPLKIIAILAGCAAAVYARADFLGITVGGQLSDPYTAQLFDNDTAIVGAGEEFLGYVSCCGGSTLAYYADVGETTVTIGIRHLGPNAIVFNGNAFTWQISGLQWGGAGDLQGFALTSVFAQTLWPSADDPNASWIGWGQDAEFPPPWDPLWDPDTDTLTLVATDGWTIPPNYDVFATFGAIVPTPTALPLMLSAIALLILGSRRRYAPR